LAVNGAKVLIVGVAYKPDVSDLRESPAIDVISLLVKKGAKVTYHDPFVAECQIDEIRYKGSELGDEVLAESDLVVILTDHTGIDYGRLVEGASRVFDTRNATRGLEDPEGKITRL